VAVRHVKTTILCQRDKRIIIFIDDGKIMENFIIELKEKIIETLYLDDVHIDDIDEEAPLVGGELGIDSIDVLELVMMIESDYSVIIDNKELGETVFQTLRTVAEHIWDNSPRFSS
jgi:acyl carrier protein